MSPNSSDLYSEHVQKKITTPQNREKEKDAEDNRHAMKLRKAFNRIKQLDASFSSEEIMPKSSAQSIKRGTIAHITIGLEDLNHSTKKIPVRAQVAVTSEDNTKPVAIRKAGTSQIRLAEAAVGFTTDDQTSGIQEPGRRCSANGTAMTKSQASVALKVKRPTELASRKPGKVVLPKSGRTAGANISDFSQVAAAACKPKTHVFFLKVHKSASSTVMNILFRFGETHNLTFALPTNGASQLYYPNYFTTAMVEGFAPGKASHFHIMCHHMRFFQPEVARVMPKSTFYFAILRNPVDLMESSFTYYKMMSPFAKARNLEEFLNQASQFYNASAQDSHYAKNLMTFDFGYNHNGNFSAKHVQLMLHTIEAQFDLLLISEYFDESMVLLKKALCWDLEDVVSFPLNSRHHSTKVHLSEGTTEKIKSWNKLDWELYVHFNRTFWEKIDWHIGREHMRQEVRALQQKREELAKVCLQEGSSVVPMSIRDQDLAPLQYGKAQILGYNLKPGLDKATRGMCRRLVTPELQYSRLLYRKQFHNKLLKFRNPAHLPKLHNRRTF
ncbi:galactose-3-O-sulfotransferase 2-like [Elgaria multicarinata webbii]|uniref:galactose-3-O-sulfotransferase 2-like n=1 Tax=Elgaria multicarinata webbii TaxID=159646 RepID=UPI002FCCC74B